jgi:hypothetical protein
LPFVKSDFISTRISFPTQKLVENYVDQFKTSYRITHLIPVNRVPEGNVVKVNHIFAQGHNLTPNYLINLCRVFILRQKNHFAFFASIFAVFRRITVNLAS